MGGRTLDQFNSRRQARAKGGKAAPTLAESSRDEKEKAPATPRPK